MITPKSPHLKENLVNNQAKVAAFNSSRVERGGGEDSRAAWISFEDNRKQGTDKEQSVPMLVPVPRAAATVCVLKWLTSGTTQVPIFW